ncbi:MAG: hypothetical protein B7C24_01210 [Bacteroidetes bacterium 4572_77]|nr:MAG: hypothetical protein B7C24_01210 [Bacteroidetes bacterium 4572_77]
MESKVYNISELQFEHRLWKSEMKIIIGELNVYQKWLGCMGQKSHSVEFQKKIEKFQNKFVIQKTHFDSFNDKINSRDNFINSLEKEQSKNVSKENITDHSNLRSDINYALKLYKELTADYKIFCESAEF